jgi:resuscitation-promoting factor RpfB
MPACLARRRPGTFDGWVTESMIDARSTAERPGIRPWAAIPGLLVLMIALFATLGACGQPQPVRVTLHADGQQQVLRVTSASALAVRDLLAATGTTLGPLDRVEPDLYVEVAEGMAVVVTRVEEQFETERQILPFAHKTVRNEAVAEGVRRLLQAGSNGEVEITYRLTLENGAEIARQEVRRETTVEPVDEVVLVGVQGELTAVPISGTIAYLSAGNAWFMRQSSDLRRNITGSADLDGRAFALSPDGSRLLFTRATAGDDGSSLNSLWLARTSLVGEEPQSLGIDGVVWAEWSPDGSRAAYSTAERSGGVPSWKANNDLWILTLPEEGAGEEPQVQLMMQPTAEMPYAWWGRSFAWSPDGESLAYAQADEVGIVSVQDKAPWTLASFVPYRTRSHWAWVPSVSWSADGYLLSLVLHEGDLEGLSPEDSPIFGLWTVSTDGKVQVRLKEEVGMWSGPRWAPAGSGAGELLAYGQAQSPRNSEDSRYELYVSDRDGSNPYRIFPPVGLMGLIAPAVAWSPKGDALVVEYEGNLYRVDIRMADMDQLTADGQSTQPRWSR